jgi:hypothetical protein
MNATRFSMSDISKVITTNDKRRWTFDPLNGKFSEFSDVKKTLLREDRELKTMVIELMTGKTLLWNKQEEIEFFPILKQDDENEESMESKDGKWKLYFEKDNKWSISKQGSEKNEFFFAVEPSAIDNSNFLDTTRNNVLGCYYNVENGNFILEGKFSHNSSFIPDEHIPAVFELSRQKVICIKLQCFVDRKVENFQKQFIDKIYVLHFQYRLAEYAMYRCGNPKLNLYLDHDRNMWVLELWDPDRNQFVRFSSQYSVSDWHDGTTMYQSYVPYNENYDIMSKPAWKINQVILPVSQMDEILQKRGYFYVIDSKTDNDILVHGHQETLYFGNDSSNEIADEELSEWSNIKHELKDDIDIETNIDTFSGKTSYNEKVKTLIFVMRWMLKTYDANKSGAGLLKLKELDLEQAVIREDVVYDVKITNENDKQKMTVTGTWGKEKDPRKIEFKWKNEYGILIRIGDDKDYEKIVLEGCVTEEENGIVSKPRILCLGKFHLHEKKEEPDRLFELCFYPNIDIESFKVDYFSKYYTESVVDILNSKSAEIKILCSNDDSQKRRFVLPTTNVEILRFDKYAVETQPATYTFEKGMMYVSAIGEKNFTLHRGISAKTWVLSLNSTNTTYLRPIVFFACWENGISDSRSSFYGYYRQKGDTKPTLLIVDHNNVNRHEERNYSIMRQILQEHEQKTDTEHNEKKLGFIPYSIPNFGGWVKNFQVYDEKTIPQLLDINIMCADEDLCLEIRCQYNKFKPRTDDWMINGQYGFRGINKDRNGKIIRINYERLRTVENWSSDDEAFRNQDPELILSTFLSLSYKFEDRGWKITKWKDTLKSYMERKKTKQAKNWGGKGEERLRQRKEKGILCLKKRDTCLQSIGGKYQMSAMTLEKTVKYGEERISLLPSVVVYVYTNYEIQITPKWQFQIFFSDKKMAEQYKFLSWSGIYTQVSWDSPYKKYDSNYGVTYQIYRKNNRLIAECMRNAGKSNEEILVSYYRYNVDNLIGSYNRKDGVDDNNTIENIIIQDVRHVYQCLDPRTQQPVSICCCAFEGETQNRFSGAIYESRKIITRTKQRAIENGTDAIPETSEVESDALNSMIHLPSLKVLGRSLIKSGKKRQNQSELKKILKLLQNKKK